MNEPLVILILANHLAKWLLPNLSLEMNSHRYLPSMDLERSLLGISRLWLYSYPGHFINGSEDRDLLMRI